jgi:hypothetical protein
LVLFFAFKKREAGLFFIFLIALYSFLAEIFINQLITGFTGSFYLPIRLYTVVEFILISIYLTKVIKNSKTVAIIRFLIFGFILFAVFDYFIAKQDSFDSIPSGVGCMLILTYSIYYLYEQIRDPNNLFLYSSPHFWVIVALIIYFSGTFFLYIYTQSSIADPTFKSSYNIINSSFIILRNLLFSIAFIIKPGKEEKSKLTARKTAF